MKGLEDVQEVWACAAGHTYHSPLGIKLEAVTCPTCASAYKGNRDERAGISKWNMSKTHERNRRGRMIKAAS